MVPNDLNAFAEMNADLRVMEFFPSPWSFEESRAAFERINDEFAGRGFGVYAMEYAEEFAGIVGLWVPSFEAYFTPTVEILWRLAPRFWYRGLATEALRRFWDMAFKILNLQEVVAFTATQNQQSIRVMERLRMKRDAEPFFDHPGISDDRLRRTSFIGQQPLRNQMRSPYSKAMSLKTRLAKRFRLLPSLSRLRVTADHDYSRNES